MAIRKMGRRVNLIGLSMLAVSLGVCSHAVKTPDPSVESLHGVWLTMPDGSVMADPQTSGLVSWRNHLLSVSDGSAMENKRMRIHKIDPASAIVTGSMPIVLSPQVASSCFATYLADAPDFEALAVDPDNDNVMVLVTEDATRSDPLSDACAGKFSHTGSTEYPTLLARLELQADDTLLLTHVRPLQYDPSFNVGDFPNDGIEGLAFASDRSLYLGLEKDKATQPRIFKVSVSADFWQTDSFAPVSDANLHLPAFEEGNHPINGMDIIEVEGTAGFLIAAARNDDEIWVIDLAGKLPTRRIPVQFLAQVKDRQQTCPEWELMDNSSLEGVAVDGQDLWLVNDPWKRNYLKNVQCESNRPHYESMAPLLFRMNIEPGWFKGN